MSQEEQVKNNLKIMADKYSLKSDEESDDSMASNDSYISDDWIIPTYKCKICKIKFMSLIQHLKKQSSCGKEYTESEWSDLIQGNNMIKKMKAINRKRRNYKNNREVVLKKNRESYTRNKDKYKPTRAAYYKANAESMKKEYQESKKNYGLEEKLRWKTEGRHFRLDELLTGYESKARKKNEERKNFLLDTRVQYIEKLKSETVTHTTIEKFTQLELLVFSKYNSFEKEIDAIMTHKKDLEETPWQSEEEWDEFERKFKNIEEHFNQLYTIFPQKDSSECPNRIIKEWKEVQDEMDKFLLNISEELDKPIPYSTQIVSDQDMAKNVVVRKRKPINFTMEDLEKDKEEENDKDFK